MTRPRVLGMLYGVRDLTSSPASAGVVGCTVQKMRRVDQWLRAVLLAIVAIGGAGCATGGLSGRRRSC